MTISIQPSAAARIAAIVSGDPREGAFFRISVDGGGCQGFSYGLDVDTDRKAGDILLDIGEGNPEVSVDPVSMALLDGSRIDWRVSLSEERFDIYNPNAVSSCGCGTSFSM